MPVLGGVRVESSEVAVVTTQSSQGWGLMDAEPHSALTGETLALGIQQKATGCRRRVLSGGNRAQLSPTVSVLMSNPLFIRVTAQIFRACWSGLCRHVFRGVLSAFPPLISDLTGFCVVCPEDLTFLTKELPNQLALYLPFFLFA
jgi:hypothetical protein